MEWHDGDYVRVILAKKGWTQVRFAEAMGMKTTTTGNLLDRSDWKGKQLAKASKVLGVNLLSPYLRASGLAERIVLFTSEDGGTMKGYLLVREDEVVQELEEQMQEWE